MALSLAHEAIKSDPRFVHLSAIAGLVVDLRYASANNFVGRNLYGDLDCAWLRVEAAQGLERAIAYLSANAPPTQLLLLDALRPQRIQEQLWANLAGGPLQRYLANPELGSMHSFGMAVDVTLIDSSGVELDMGSGFDQMDETSHPEFEVALQASGKLTSDQIARRNLLRTAMQQGNFNGIRTEWWHFDCGDKNQVRKDFERII